MQARRRCASGLRQRRNPRAGSCVHSRVRPSLSSPPCRPGVAIALLLALSIAGCSKSSSSPTAPGAPVRSVAVAAADSTFAPVPGATVSAFGLDNSNAADRIPAATTDTAGVAGFSLHDGHWCMFARLTPASGPLLVAGSIGLVSAKPAGSVDSVLFRLAMRPESIAHGTILLSGQSTHAGSLVGVIGLPAFDVTGSDGSFTLRGLPPGTWVGLASHDGYAQTQFTVAVPAPGQTLTILPIVLTPSAEPALTAPGGPAGR